MLCFRDHVQWSDEEKEKARQKAEENSSVRIPLKEQGKQSFTFTKHFTKQSCIYLAYVQGLKLVMTKCW